MNILFIAPLPPPIDGQSKASKVLLDHLQKNHEVQIVDLNKKSLKNGVFSFERAIKIFSKIIEVWKYKSEKDIIYLSLAESFAGNLRDLAIYMVNYGKLDHVFIHMLGGAGMKEILSGQGFVKKLNSHFMNRLGGVIVEGEVNYQMFGKVMEKEKVHIVPNFAESYLFVEESEIDKKFNDTSTINILYLSNLIPGKGYGELADSYIGMTEESRSRINITFVGGFESTNAESDFLTKIEPFSQLKYLGKFIDGQAKRKLYCQSHIFCLPTYYPFEGQPISILEAYASGCVVITSDHSGIPYIFKNRVNGIQVEKKSVQSIQSALELVINGEIDLKAIAYHNRKEALGKYKTEIFQRKISAIFEKSISERMSNVRTN